MWTVTDRWKPWKAPRGVARVEVWQRGVQVASVDDSDILDGTVTDRKVIGVRRSLSMSVEPSAKWLRLALLPGLEIRPYAGFSWGNAEYLCPMGRFPILPPQVSLPRQEISFNGDDYWTYMQRAKFLYPQQSWPGDIPLVVGSLITAAGLPEAVITRGVAVGMPDVMWDKTYHDIAADALESVGAEAFIDREGQPIVQDFQYSTGRALTDGEQGTVISITSKPDWSEVYNELAITSSNTDVKFEPVTLAITDTAHPAYWANGLGHKGLTISSPLYVERAQAQRAAPGLLAKNSAAALGWEVTALPDPSADAGDRVAVSTDLGEVDAVIEEVKHSLKGDPMTLTLGAWTDPTWTAP